MSDKKPNPVDDAALDHLKNEIVAFLTAHRHGPSISLARIGNAFPHDRISGAVSDLESEGRIRIVRYDGAPWSYHAVVPSITPSVVEPCEGCPDPGLPCAGCPAVEPQQSPILDTQPVPAEDSHPVVEPQQETPTAKCYGCGRTVEVIDGRFVPHTVKAERGEATCEWGGRFYEAGDGQRVLDTTTNPPAESCDLDACNGAMCAACAPGSLRERLMERDADICEHGAWQETCAACGERARIKRIIEYERDQYEPGGDCHSVCNDLLAAIDGGDDA